MRRKTKEEARKKKMKNRERMKKKRELQKKERCETEKSGPLVCSSISPSFHPYGRSLTSFPTLAHPFRLHRFINTYLCTYTSASLCTKVYPPIYLFVRTPPMRLFSWYDEAEADPTPSPIDPLLSYFCTLLFPTDRDRKTEKKRARRRARRKEKEKRTTERRTTGSRKRTRERQRQINCKG